MKTVGIGIIGCGRISRMHGESLGKVANARIVACTDIDKERARASAEAWNCDFCHDLDELLAREDVHLVYILSPNALHADHGVTVANAGKHLLIEKPITTTIEDADRVIAAGHRNKVKLAVGFYRRFTKLYRKVKEILECGVIGKPFSTAISIRLYRDEVKYFKNRWQGDPKMSGGGVFIMNAIHELDLMRFVLSSEATRVYAEGGNLVKESISMEDTSHVMIRLTNNSICSIEATTSAKGFEERIDFEILGSHGSIRVADSGYTANSFSLFTEKQDSGFESGRWIEVPAQQAIREAFTSQAQHMIDCILKDKTPLVTGEDARKTLELTLAAYRSMETHRSVALDTRA